MNFSSVTDLFFELLHRRKLRFLFRCAYHLFFSAIHGLVFHLESAHWTMLEPSTVHAKRRTRSWSGVMLIFRHVDVVPCFDANDCVCV